MKLFASDIMPTGKYSGRRMSEVPADYLMWLYDNDRCVAEVRDYIVRNLGWLREKAERKKLARSWCCGTCGHSYNGVYAGYRRLMCAIAHTPVKWKRPACENYDK